MWITLLIGPVTVTVTQLASQWQLATNHQFVAGDYNN
jgi:hypothetical protein